MNHRRSTSPPRKSRRPSKSQQRWARRILLAEHLESRQLLAGDLNFHNAFFPQDVDQNNFVSARDALVIINQLNAGGPRQFLGGSTSSATTSSTAEGEGEATTSDALYMYDVNNDGYVSASDAMRVVNLLNEQAGEHAEVMEFRIVYLQPGTNNPIPGNTITKGTDFEIAVIVQDIRGQDQIGPVGDRGVAAASIDLLLNTKALARVELEEVQTVRITGNPTGGTFTLTFNDGTAIRTTAGIQYNPLVESRVAIANRIQTALAALSNIGAGNVEVVPADAIFGGVPTDFVVRFQGALGNKSLQLMTGNPSQLTGGTNPQIQITELFDGSFSTESFRRSLLRRYQVVGGQLIADYNTVVTGADASNPDRIDNAGGLHSDFLSVGHFPDGQEADPRLLLRFRMDTLDAGNFTVVGSVLDVDENLLYSVLDATHGDPLDPSEIKITNPPVLKIIEPFSANPDAFTFAEDLGVQVGTPAPVTLNVLTNDTTNNSSGAPAGALPTSVIISALNGVSVTVGQSIVTSAGGTVTLNTGSKTLNYLPAPNHNGTDVFTYTIRNPNTGVTDTATVTITLTPVNDAPINTLPSLAAARTVAEDGTLTFPGNISVADVDAGGNDIQTSLSVANGTLTLSTTTGLTFIAGDGISDATVTFQGTVAEINAALNGMQYKPNANFNGNDTLQMITSDLGNSPAPALSDSDSMAIIVTAVNDAPTISVPGPQSAIETLETTLGAITVDDVDFLPATVMQVSLSVDGLGSFTLASLTGLSFTTGDGTADSSMAFSGTLANVNAALAGIKYTAGLGDASAPRTLSITNNDGGASGAGGPLSAAASVTIDVVPLDRPFARDDAFTVNEDSTAADAPNPLPVLDNDFKDEGNTLVIVAITQPANGTVIDNGDGTLSYVPDADFFGTDTFTYTINQTIDPKAPEDLDENQIATVTITVINTPDPPVANDDTATTDEDTTVAIAVMANDRDIDLSVNPANQTPTSATHTVTVISGPSNGTTQVIDGVVHYTPAQDYHGPDSFVYQLSDGTFTDTATVSITVNPVNDAPVANPDSAAVDEDTFVDVAVLANDRDVDLGTTPATQIPTTATHSVIVVGNPARGTVSVNADGSIRYTPAADYFGPDSFTYKVNDGLLDSNTATVSITVNNTPDAPVANDDNVVTFEDTPLSINVMNNDWDVDLGVTPLTQIPTAATHTVTIEVQPLNGSVSINAATGVVTYTPNLNFNGNDSFTYRLTDGSGLFDTAVVNVRVDDVNDAPEAFNDSATTDEDTPIFIPVLANDRDVDLGDTPAERIPTSTTHTIAITTPPSHGTAQVQLDGTVLYTPAANYHGPDLFRYRINDGFLNSNIADVNITVISVNDPPVVADDFFTAIKHNPPTQDFANQQIFVLANDQVNDPDPGEVLTIVSVIQPVNGSVTIAGDGKSVFYTPNVGYEGPDFFTYTVEDNGTNPDNLQATATVTIDVVNFIPTDISGTVWMDTDNDGLMEDHERRLAGVDIRIQGTSFRGITLDQTVQTDINGFYIFLDVEPGDYTVTQSQPFYLKDGKDVFNTTTNGFDTTIPIVTGSFNDQFTISIPLLSTDNPSKTLSGNNFGEMGLDSAYINIAELLASTTNNGFLLAIGPGSESLWHQKMDGWDGALSCSVVLNSTDSLTFSVFDGVTTRTTTLTQSGTTRFRIVGQDGSGGYLIRIEGSAEDFGWTLAAAQPQAEGESDYTRDVDAVMSSLV
ncbi:MAG TPA: Ig-like domain-containing protein [Pirellulaceae bacterium]|nr:Ig-like domain-containing protein [Pirellulaceae bacterium]